MKILKKILFILFGVFVSVACLDCPFNNTRLISVGYRLNASNNSLAVENNHL